MVIMQSELVSICVFVQQLHKNCVFKNEQFMISVQVRAKECYCIRETDKWRGLRVEKPQLILAFVLVDRTRHK